MKLLSYFFILASYLLGAHLSYAQTKSDYIASLKKFEGEWYVMRDKVQSEVFNPEEMPKLKFVANMQADGESLIGKMFMQTEDGEWKLDSEETHQYDPKANKVVYQGTRPSEGAYHGEMLLSPDGQERKAIEYNAQNQKIVEGSVTFLSEKMMKAEIIHFTDKEGKASDQPLGKSTFFWEKK